MKITAVFKEFSDHGGETLEWISEFEKRAAVKVERVNPETRDGEGYIEAHGILAYPTIVASGDDGKVYSVWAGKPLPTFDEVMSFMV